MEKIAKKASRGKIKVDFEDRTPLWTRLKTKIFSMYFVKNVLWYLFRFVLMLGISYVILYPFISKIAHSFMAPTDFIDAKVCFIPRSYTLDIYKAIFLENHYMQAFVNTLILSLACAVIQTLISCIIGYGLAKFKFRGNKLIMVLVIITMIIPHETVRMSLLTHFRAFDIGGVMGLRLPGLMELISGNTLDLTDTYWPFVILSVTGLAFKNGLYIYLLRQFFRGVPDELEESAYVDGSGVFRTFFTIILPLAIPMMITVFLFSFSWQWTDDFYTELFFTANSKTVLMPDIIEIPASLKSVLFAAQADYNTAIRNTAGLMIILPLVVIYLFCQRFLVQGIERSGLVG